MRFNLSLLGVDVFGFELVWPSRGMYEVPDYIPSEDELEEFYGTFETVDRPEDED